MLLPAMTISVVRLTLVEARAATAAKVSTPFIVKLTLSLRLTSSRGSLRS
jgi:hypothetical protein